MNLINLSSIGNKFTWFYSSGNAMSRFGMILMSEDLIDKWKIDGHFEGKKGKSEIVGVFRLRLTKPIEAQNFLRFSIVGLIIPIFFIFCGSCFEIL